MSGNYLVMADNYQYHAKVFSDTLYHCSTLELGQHCWELLRSQSLPHSTLAEQVGICNLLTCPSPFRASPESPEHQGGGFRV